MPPKKKSKVGEGKAVNVPEDAHEATASNSKRGRKKSKASGEEGAAEDAKPTKTLLNQANTEFENQDFTSTATTVNGKAWNLKIATWNVDGIRAWVKVNFNTATQ